MTARPQRRPDWPRLMRADTAAEYCDEVSVEAFRRRVGSVYPSPVTVAGRGQVWLRDHLDAAIDRLDMTPQAAQRAADLADLI